MFKNALISVSDKNGLLEFVRPLVARGMRVVSTGGTYEFLKKNSIPVIEISEQTKFPEVMGGRVKTLHPMVHMGLLSREGNTEDQKILQQHGLENFDLLVCNLYPFEESVVKGLQGQELIEKIDIGGPSMLRSAAKNFQRLTVVCDPKDYLTVQSQPNTLEARKKLAAKVFAHTAAYDSLVAKELGAGWGDEFSIGGHNVIELRYGENPQQNARWYREIGNSSGLHSAEVVQGKPLSYNNILDLDAAVNLASKLPGQACVAVKHNNPCGVGCHETDTHQAVLLALKADPISVFGGIVAINAMVTSAIANSLNEIFLECIVAPEFSPEALEIFAKKKNLRILKMPNFQKAERQFDLRGVLGGFLIQQADNLASDENNWKFLGKKPDTQILKDLRFAEIVCSSLKSNSIAIVKNEQSLGLGMGQVNRVEAVNHAIERMKKHHGQIQNVVMASDAFFPFADSIEVAANAGIKWILQPGGSIKDEEVINKAKELGIEMVLTGTRHFRH
jgi:phosphoribosylaminoimidazolecarboxamide formyltransferase/IMP cyclohydrolase